TYDEAILRHAQMAHDFGTPGPHITFSWPSAAQPLGYVRDHDSINIARDDLEELLIDLAQGNRDIVLLGHSMGSQLVVET
ncbi:alpha/beta hydrolase, partial [Streptomyces sp. URMC 126]|uniref:alpha/beta hydrolase n=1 Tax=Streptomyces sp. URMC 126 TaxID=3423401 RepID=UPI003F1DAE3B